MEHFIYALHKTVGTRQMLLSNARNGSIVTKGENLKFYLTLINLHLNSHMWPGATILDSPALNNLASNTKMSACHVNWEIPLVGRNDIKFRCCQGTKSNVGCKNSTDEYNIVSHRVVAH